jgi:hypothetical protein
MMGWLARAVIMMGSTLLRTGQSIAILLHLAVKLWQTELAWNNVLQTRSAPAQLTIARAAETGTAQLGLQSAIRVFQANIMIRKQMS